MSKPLLTKRTINRLVRWYRANLRDMPWRWTRDPYRIWVSEILLQQTQVQTVIPYYHRFLEAFPTVRALAEAPLDAVLKAWEGCGYYARARNLHRAAQIVMNEYNGRIPDHAAALIRLPGIGKYTAAAIASLAFDEPVAVIDGNIERVLARILCEKRLLKMAPVLRRLDRTADGLMQAAVELGIAPREFNQAIMELGATVCMPRLAWCAKCPLKSECRARAALTDVTLLPRKAASPVVPHYDIGAAIIQRNGLILITQRPSDGLLGGLWEFPGGKRHDGETLEECTAREIREELAIEIEVGDLVVKVRHAYSHFKITLHAFACRYQAGRIRKIGVADYRWVKPEELSRFAFPKADRAILEKLAILSP
ncbi:MAG: A/G-specific adenine glycosylase [Calditrichota bacterium]